MQSTDRGPAKPQRQRESSGSQSGEIRPASGRLIRLFSPFLRAFCSSTPPPYPAEAVFLEIHRQQPACYQSFAFSPITNH